MRAIKIRDGLTLNWPAIGRPIVRSIPRRPGRREEFAVTPRRPCVRTVAQRRRVKGSLDLGINDASCRERSALQGFADSRLGEDAAPDPFVSACVMANRESNSMIRLGS